MAIVIEFVNRFMSQSYLLHSKSQ